MALGMLLLISLFCTTILNKNCYIANKNCPTRRAVAERLVCLILSRFQVCLVRIPVTNNLVLSKIEKYVFLFIIHFAILKL